MPFERFTESGKGYRPRISIRPSGTIGINDSALKRFGLKSLKYVALYFDAETKRIAIGGAQEDEPGAQRLNLAGKGASISARRFLDYHDLGVKTTTQYECHLDEGQKLIILDKEIKRKERKTNPVNPIS